MTTKAVLPLALSIQYAEGRSGLPARSQFRQWVKAAQLHAAEVTVRIVNAEEGRRLNRDFRNRDSATNVLTFVYSTADEPPCGDIALCAPVVAQEAAEQGKSLLAHYAHLVIHGMLHLQGYDHEVSEQATAMEAVESFIMMKLGFPDPYLHHVRRQ